MLAPEYAARIEAVKQRAHGRWTPILASLGVDERILRRRNLPCPLCGGTDRFQYTDKFGEGNYHCRSCGPGGGFKLLQAVLGIDFNTALREVERCVGVLPVAAAPHAGEPSAERMKKLAQRIWNEARPVTPGDEVDRYLRGRGLALPAYPKVLRFHPALGYYQKDATGRSRKVAEYPAMLACIQGTDGHAVTLHRTYLKDGAKLAAPDAKKVLSAGINGAAVRLFEATGELAVAEGIEKGLAVHLATGKPVWASLNAGNLEKLWLPDTVRTVCIYADNDADGDFAGQAFAFALARSLKRNEAHTGPRQVKVFVPRHPGIDWDDVWRQRQQAQAARAA
ncbi:zinc-binding protein [Pseudothauera nasutitermitis]|uniref:Zinc-binding protein n=1 Tax=Pseudothauera nasutitermitis TaxID=2565930 RepID=A0A4S4AXX9_9RHOO|nr:toprim domain-containing protein [Pseudothauera nasutitermitis]THF64962.1 zinc-binding protein [Pseudothauera nasutitermitis]